MSLASRRPLLLARLVHLFLTNRRLWRPFDRPLEDGVDEDEEERRDEKRREETRREGRSKEQGRRASNI